MGFAIGAIGPFLLSISDYYYLSKALNYYGLSFSDLGYFKDISAETNLKPKGFLNFLKNPIKIDTFGYRILSNVPILSIETIINEYYDVKLTGPYSIVFDLNDTLFSEFEMNIKYHLQKVLKTAEIYSFYMEHANITLDEIETLIKFAKENIKDDSSNISKDSILSYLRKTNFRDFFYAHLTLLNAFIELKDAIKVLKGKSINLVYETQFGKILITDSLLPSDSDFIYINTRGSQKYDKICNSNIRICTFFDLEGNDIYSLDSFSVYSEYGFVFFYENEGDDTYKCLGFCLSSSILGLSYFEDSIGNDYYDSGKFSISASYYGISIFLDKVGDDIYRSVNSSLAFSGIWGISLFKDESGNDSYYLGRYFEHKPLWENEYFGLGLGFSIGIREDIAGGISVFVDLEGNDLYSCGTYCLGSAYWYSAGIFMDLKGNDRYIGVQYGIGSGIHIAIGGFFDLEGNDIYIFKAGPSIGSAHDFGIGFFYDKIGDDIYYVSGGIGNSIANGLGIFIDAKGNDIYNFTEYGLSCGASQKLDKQREFLGLGIFIDKEGNDIYPFNAKCKNSSTWKVGDIGIGFDGY